MIKYTKDHDWLGSSDDGATVGFTEHATSGLDDIVYIKLPEVGIEVTKGEEVVMIGSARATSGIVAPFDGVTTEANQTMIDSPETIDENPADSWFFKTRPEDPSMFEEYLDEGEYKALIG